MYHLTEMANAVTPTSWFYPLYTHALLNQSQREYPSRIKSSFLLDPGASISVLNCIKPNKEDDSRQFTIPFAVADIKYKNLGTPFFEEFIQNKNIKVQTVQTPITSLPKLFKIYITLIQRLPIFFLHIQNQF